MPFDHHLASTHAAPAPRRPRRLLVATASVLGALLFSACDGSTEPRGVEDKKVAVLQTSAAWQRTVPADTFRARAQTLRSALDALRSQTRSGWIGRQDDVTGYLTELTGGRFATGDGDAERAARAFFTAHGPALFGAPVEQLAFGAPDQPDATGSVVLRAEQRLRDVSMLDAELRVSVAGDGNVTAVRGRTYEALQPSATSPAISRARARRIAVRADDERAAGRTRLVYVPEPPVARLAWEVLVVGGDGHSTQQRFVDAVSGDLIASRAASAALITFPVDLRAAQSAPGTKVTGVAPDGSAVEAVGQQQPDGRVALIDGSSSAKAIISFDAGGQETTTPTVIITCASSSCDDSEAVAAHAYSRAILDYFHGVHGRASWDGKGGELRSILRFGSRRYCNAFFSWKLGVMAFGSGCETSKKHVHSFVDPDVTAHEIAHGVTGSSANLVYAGESGAMNESYSDYFGNVIGDRLLGRDSDGVGEAMCTGITPPTIMCERNPDGSVSTRYLPNGAGAKDYLPLLVLPLRLEYRDHDTDHGGVHLNSAIWNNALWSIRKKLAAIDGAPMLQSERAQLFDRVVYLSLTRYLTPTSTFLDGRRAIEQAAVDMQADPAAQRVIREHFDLLGICASCTERARSQGLVVSAAGGQELAPHVVGDAVTWIENTGEGAQAYAATLGGQVVPVGDRTSLASAFAGANLLTFNDRGAVQLHAAGAAARTLDQASLSNDDLVVGVAGSAEGGAWMVNTQIGYVDASGTVSKVAYPVRGGEPTAIAAGGGTVAVGDKKGSVVVWRVGEQPRTFRSPLPVVDLAVRGTRVLVTAKDDRAPFATVTVLDVESGTPTVLSQTGQPWGVALSDTYAVWTQAVGTLQGKVAELLPEKERADTAFYLYSLRTGKTYSLYDAPGQQGFPSISGNRLVWQDTLHSSNDIYTGLIPEGL